MSLRHVYYNLSIEQTDSDIEYRFQCVYHIHMTLITISTSLQPHRVYMYMYNMIMMIRIIFVINKY